jgi:hypothetical protein
MQESDEDQFKKSVSTEEIELEQFLEGQFAISDQLLHSQDIMELDVQHIRAHLLDGTDHPKQIYRAAVHGLLAVIEVTQGRVSSMAPPRPREGMATNRNGGSFPPFQHRPPESFHLPNKSQQPQQMTGGQELPPQSFAAAPIPGSQPPTVPPPPYGANGSHIKNATTMMGNLAITNEDLSHINKRPRI